QICGEIRLAEKRKRNVLALLTHPELLKEGPQGMPREDDVDRTIAPDDEETRGLRATPQHPEEIERRVVAPVEVLEDKDERTLCGESLERLGHLPQHPFLRDAEQIAPERIAIVSVDEPRQLDDPGRRIALEDAERPVGLAQQASQGLQDG